MRLIDADAVQRWLADWQYGEAPNPGDTKEDKDKAIVRYEVLDIVISGLDDPHYTIDAEPVRHGKWVRDEVDKWKCSACGAGNNYAYEWNVSGEKLQDNYCPNCGARMDGEEEKDHERLVKFRKRTDFCSDGERKDNETD